MPIAGDLNKNRIRTIGELAADEMRKSLGDGDSDDHVQRLNARLHDEVIPAFQAAWNNLVEVTAAGNSMMDPKAKAANKIAGRDADAEVERLRSQRFNLEKAIAAEAAAQRPQSSARPWSIRHLS